MLLQTGEIADEYAGMGYLQEGVDSKLEVNEVFRASTAYSAIVTSPTNAGRLIEAALRTALDVPRHAAHLSLPVNVTVAKLDGKIPAMPKTTSAYRSGPPVAPARDVSVALEMLVSSRRPLIMLGNGCREALRDKATYDAFPHFVEARGIPVMTRADGKGVFPEDHELSLRAYGIANAIWPYYWLSQTDPDYDLLMVIGSGFGGLAPTSGNRSCARGERSSGPPPTRGSSPATFRWICASAARLATSSAERRGSRAPCRASRTWKTRKAKIADIKASRPRFAGQAAYDSTSSPMHPAALCKACRRFCPGRIPSSLSMRGTASAGRSAT